jgi:hypothetical protein
MTFYVQKINFLLAEKGISIRTLCSTAWHQGIYHVGSGTIE